MNMVILRIPVECIYCNKNIDKRTALFVKNSQSRNLYQCDNCFKENSERRANSEKVSLYCEGCRYKFTSRKAVCPYCNKYDSVVKTDIKISDLI